MKRLVMVALMLSSMLTVVAEVRPKALRCEHLVNPVGIDVVRPRFSWQMEDAEHVRGRGQTAYHLLVASSVDLLENDQGDLWDSGKVVGNQSVLVAYGGSELRSNMECHWKVRLWTEDQKRTEWSEPSRFTVGPLHESDWEGPWITFGDDPVTKQAVPVTKHLWLRRNLDLDGPPRSAIIHVASIGYHELHINGQRPDERVLAPTLTRLDKRVHYVSYDIARLLRAGTNTIAIHYGPGWSRYDYFRTSRAIRVQLQATGSQGNPITLVSDKHWRYRVGASENTGGCKWNNNGGERLDATRLVADWNMPSHDDGSWAQAVETERDVMLSAEMIPPSRIIATIPAIQIKSAGTSADGAALHQVVLEKNYTGFLRMTVRGQARGDRITMTVADSPGSKSVFNQFSEYVCQGSGEESFQHRFNYCAGRYIMIAGLKQKPVLKDVVGLAVSNALDRTGSFECSNPLFNRIYETDVWTYLANTTEGFTADCPHRERMGYGEVAFATSWGIGLPNFETGAFYTKVIRDWSDVQEENGWIHHTAPQINQHYGGPMWSSAGLNVASEAYLHHGDRRMLELNHSSARKWLDFLHHHVKGGLLRNYNPHWGKFLGDWAAPGARNERGDSPAAEYFNNCVYAMNLSAFIRHAGFLGKPEETAVYQQRLGEIREAIHRNYYRAETGNYCDGTQVQQAFALLAEVCPPELRSKCLQNLLDDIGKRGYLDMGSSGLPVLLKFMIEQSGESAVLSGPLNRTEIPSYGFFLKAGQSTWPEHWEPRASNIHTCYTGIASWFIKSVAGIRPDPAAPGYQRFIIHPVLAEGLSHARGSTGSPYGTIVSDWQRQQNQLDLRIEIPPNSSATVYLPTRNPQAVRKTVAQSEGVSFLRDEPNRVVIQVESGHYHFEVPVDGKITE